VAGWNGRNRESTRAVEQDWLKRGIVSRESKKPFTRQNLGQMLRRKAYVGIRVHKGTERPGNWPALVEPALFNAVQVILADPSRRSTTTTAVKHVLTGVLRCDTCGGKVSLRPGGRAYDGRLVYRCYARDCFTVDKADVDAYLIGDAEDPGEILSFLAADDVYEALTAEGDGEELKGVRAQLSAKRADLKEFEDAEPARTLTESRERARSVELLESEIAELESQERTLTRPNPLKALFPPSTNSVAARWEATDITAQRAIVGLLLTSDVMGQVRVRRVADSASGAVQDRIHWVTT